jgi:hypothetical protein
MLSGKGTVLISQKQNEYLTYQIYDHKPEYIQTLNQAALELGYDSLISYLKKNSSPIEFNSLALYTCTEELMDLKPNSKLMISEDYQIFFFTELNDIKNLAIERSISKEAPMHKNKNSVADTLIILSFLEFVSANPENHYLFVSENIEDFFEIDPKKKFKDNFMLELCYSFEKDLIGKSEFLSDLINYFTKSHK